MSPVVTPRRSAAAALIAVGYFVVTSLVLHLLRPDVDPLRQSMSQYQRGRLGFVMVLGFLAVSLAAVALAAGLRAAQMPAGGSRAGTISLLLFAIVFVLVAAFPPDASGNPDTASGQVHNLGGLLGLISMTVAAVLFSLRFRRDERWRSVFGVSMAVAVLIPVSIVGLILSPSALEGLFDRLGPPTFISLWMLMVAWRLYAVSGDTASA